MEEEQVAAVADAEAPPGDAGDIADAESSPPGEGRTTESGVTLADDWSNADEVIAALTAEANAEAERQAASATHGDIAPDAPITPDAGNTLPLPGVMIDAAAKDPPPTADYTALIADLQARGFKVEPPAPPPDPFAELRNELAPFVGNERYEQLKSVALQPVPAEPENWDQDTVAAHEARIREVNEAKAELRQMDVNRKIHGTSYAWARQQLLNEAGSELAALPQKYPGADPSRVATPKSLTDAVDAVAESVAARKDAEWQAKYDAREKYWQGKVAQASTDRSVARHQQMAGATPATSIPGGRAASPGRLPIPSNPVGQAADDFVAAAIRGDFANIDTSDR